MLIVLCRSNDINTFKGLPEDLQEILVESARMPLCGSWYTKG